MKLVWNGDAVDARIKRGCGENIEAAGDYYANQLRNEIDTVGPPRSEPGNPPHIDTYELINSIQTDFDPSALASRTLSDVPHAVYLEMGTVHMEPRPAWRRLVMELAENLGRLACRPLS